MSFMRHCDRNVQIELFAIFTFANSMFQKNQMRNVIPREKCFVFD